MQQVASDDGMAPVAGKTNKPSTEGVGGLIAAVESKMAELMAWHDQQTKQLDTDKTVHEAQVEQQRTAFATERKQLAERVAQVDQQRIKLVELTSKLRAEETAMSREWAEVQRERESIQRQATELAEQRQRVDERAKAWLEKTAEQLSQPLKLTETHDDNNKDETPDRHAA